MSHSSGLPLAPLSLLPFAMPKVTLPRAPFTLLLPAAWLTLLIAAQAAHAAGKPCEELAAEIAAKLDASGVTGYVLEIVPNALVGGEKVVGSCESGTKKITYAKDKRKAPPAAAR
jgi:hypothetical protein